MRFRFPVWRFKKLFVRHYRLRLHSSVSWTSRSAGVENNSRKFFGEPTIRYIDSQTRRSNIFVGGRSEELSKCVKYRRDYNIRARYIALLFFSLSFTSVSARLFLLIVRFMCSNIFADLYMRRKILKYFASS